jgi:DedD protein
MESALKHRLLGAAVLIALAVIFVPMFFSNTPPKAENTTQNLNIPPAPERNFETRTLTVDPSSPASSTATPTIPAVPARADGDKVTTVTTAAPSTFEAPDATAPAKPSITTAAPAAAATASIKPMTPPPTAPTPPPIPATQADGRFLVNLGVYSDAAHVTALVDKVKKLGFPAFAEATEFQGKTAQRVRVGPYADRAAAENVRLKIKQVDEKVPSSVVETAESAKPTVATPSAGKAMAAAESPAPTLPGNRAGGYAVQVGAFKSEEEANKVRDRLRNGGVAAFVDKSSDGEQTLWKVRAGPYADRSGADSAVTSIKQKFQLNGMVRTLP